MSSTAARWFRLAFRHARERVRRIWTANVSRPGHIGSRTSITNNFALSQTVNYARRKLPSSTDDNWAASSYRPGVFGEVIPVDSLTSLAKTTPGTLGGPRGCVRRITAGYLEFNRKFWHGRKLTTDFMQIQVRQNVLEKTELPWEMFLFFLTKNVENTSLRTFNPLSAKGNFQAHSRNVRLFETKIHDSKQKFIFWSIWIQSL